VGLFYRSQATRGTNKISKMSKKFRKIGSSSITTGNTSIVVLNTVNCQPLTLRPITIKKHSWSVNMSICLITIYNCSRSCSQSVNIKKAQNVPPIFLLFHVPPSSLRYAEHSSHVDLLNHIYNSIAPIVAVLRKT